MILGGPSYPRLKNYFYGVMFNRSRSKLGSVQKYEESAIVDYIKKIQKKGHPITLTQLWLKVVEVHKEGNKGTPFKNGILGWGWV